MARCVRIPISPSEFWRIDACTMLSVVVSSPYSYSCEKVPKDAEDQLEAAMGATNAIKQVHGTTFMVQLWLTSLPLSPVHGRIPFLGRKPMLYAVSVSTTPVSRANHLFIIIIHSLLLHLAHLVIFLTGCTLERG